MTKEAQAIQDVLDAIHNLESMEDENGGLTPDEQTELEILQNTLEGMGKICPHCDGDGRVVNQKKIHSLSIDVPYTNCPECGGGGII